LQDLADRFSTDIHPLMTRDAGGCIACHASDSGRLMLMATTPQETFFRIRSEGFFELTTGKMTARVVDESMPQLGPAWSEDEKNTMIKFSCDLATIDGAGTPPDEEFPPDLLTPFTGTAVTDYDNTFLTYDQLRGRVIQAFDDDWVRLGVDQFSENIALFGAWTSCALSSPRARRRRSSSSASISSLKTCVRARSRVPRPFAGLDLNAAITQEPASALTSFEAETATFTGLPSGCFPGATRHR